MTVEQKIGLWVDNRSEKWTNNRPIKIEAIHLKVLITRLLFVLEVWNGKPTYRKSWAGNLLVWSDLTLDPAFKVKQG